MTYSSTAFTRSTIALGIPGIFVLLSLLISTAVKAFRKSNYILLSLLIAVVINCLTEGILEKQAGVLFFVFFMIVLNSQQKNFSAYQKAEA